MVREIVTIDWCDLCMRDDRRERVEESHRVVIDGKSFNVDLCAEHVGEFKSFVDLVAVASATSKEAHAVTGSAKASRHERRCLLCSWTCNSPSSLGKHVQATHGLANAGAMFGHVCPLCEHKATTGQGAGLHARNEHRAEYPGVVDTPTSFIQALALGDPHGVVERATKAATKASERALAARAVTVTVPTLEGV